MPQQPTKNIKTTLSDIIVKLIIAAGICLLLYPTVSDKWNDMHTSQIIEGYAHAVENFTEKDYTDILTTAQEYNKKLIDLPDRFSPDETQLQEYSQTLNITGDGLMAYVEIPKINVKLPIYHTVNEAVLQIAAGHMPGSSLPIGGPSTHSAISGHTGMTSATLFTRLKDLELGDLFYIQVMDQILAYQVDKIDIVLPDEFDLLHIEDGQDYCTLITCTPYGVNSHRLLVRGTRVEYRPEVKNEIIPEKQSDNISNLNELFFYTGILAIICIIVINVKNGVKKIQARKRFERRFRSHENDEENQ